MAHVPRLYLAMSCPEPACVHGLVCPAYSVQLAAHCFTGGDWSECARLCMHSWLLHCAGQLNEHELQRSHASGPALCLSDRSLVQPRCCWAS